MVHDHSFCERYRCISHNCYKGGSYCYEDVLTGGVFKRAPEARASRGVWGHAPPGNFEI